MTKHDEAILDSLNDLGPIRNVIGVERGITSSGMGRYALLRLECGHCAGRVPEETDYTCCKCGALVNDTADHRKECGGLGFNVGETRELPLPDNMRCRCCKRATDDLKRIPELVSKSIYSRFRPLGSEGMITFYERDSTSPTGVRSCGSVTPTKEIEALISRLNSSCSPLSPTER